MLALIDADLVAWRCASVVKDNSINIAKWQTDQMVSRILEETDATDWKLFLSGDNNFRYKLFPDYKANRKYMVRPQHLEALREHLVLEWQAEVTDGYEADDAIGIRSQEKSEQSKVIVSIDKDLRQLAGSHYHFVNRQFLEISELDGWRNFYLSLLMGDTADNISGCPGIGQVKGTRALEYLFKPEDMYAACKRMYEKAKVSIEQMHLNAQLLYIWRQQQDSWKPPQPANITTITKPEQAVPPSSLPSTPDISSEPIPEEVVT